MCEISIFKTKTLAPPSVLWKKEKYFINEI